MTALQAARSRFSWLAVPLAALLVTWSAVDHPLYPSDEGRYAVVAATMAESGDWIVPTLGGTPHLTKPPLAYWAEAVGIAALGRTELAARLPSLLAAVATLGVVFAITRRLRGDAAAIGATLLLGILPIFMFVSRIGATDSLLTFLWSLATVLGYLVVAGETRSRRAIAGFWLCLGLAALTKGPAAIGPLATLVAWRALAGDLRSLSALQPWWGIPIAALPVAAWATGLWMRDAALLDRLTETWRVQSIGRVTGELGKRDPWWFYAPVFLVGLFPATAMLTLPWTNLSWGDAWRSVRSGSFEALLVVAVLLPLVGFSLSSGKLPTYIAPVAPPLAILVAIMLARQWIGHDPAYDRPPDVRWTLLATVGLAALAAMVGPRIADALAPGRVDLSALQPGASALFVPALLGAIALVVSWRSPGTRSAGLAVAWLGFAGSWMLAFHLENVATRRESPALLANALREHFGDDAPIFVVGTTDATRSFYRRGAVRELGGNPPSWTIGEAMSASRGAVIEDVEWEELQRLMPEIAVDLPPVAEVPGFFGRRYVVVQVGRSK
jgi:4-amino-4-deoxy-L-arabinose transferase-like glycosyltransferase